MEVRSKSPQNIATKFVAQGSLYGQCRRIENLIGEQNYFLKSDFDHVDFAVPARNINLTCWTTALEVCWSVRLPTCTTVVTKALAAFFPFFDMLQYFGVSLRTQNHCKRRYTKFLSCFELLSKTISAKTIYGNPLSFGV